MTPPVYTPDTSYGIALLMQKGPTMFDDKFKARFWAKVDKTTTPDGCWEWTAARKSKGYGHFSVEGRVRMAHRVSYEMLCGPIPEGLCVLHACDNPACVRLDHLRVGTNAENIEDRETRGRGVRLVGSAHRNSKFTPEDVREIRANPDRTLVSFARQFGVTPEAVAAIRTRKLWKHIP